MCLVTAGCEMRSSAAALVKLSLSATVLNTFSLKSVIILSVIRAAEVGVALPVAGRSFRAALSEQKQR